MFTGTPPALCICATARIDHVSLPAVLALADGTIFRGQSIGAKGNTTGEVVFNTALTGYQEILTDPSYARQIVTLTYPHIGNTGTTPEDLESPQIYCRRPHHPRPAVAARAAGVPTSRCRSSSQRGRVVAIAGIDTRKLTRILREKGAQAGCIMTGEQVDRGRGRASSRASSRASRAWISPRWSRPRRATSGTRARIWPEPARAPIRANQRLHVVAYDFGIKRNILRLLADAGCRMTVVPAQTTAAEVLALEPDGVFLSNGPGDPGAVRLRHQRHADVPRDRPAGVRHLPGSPDPGTGRGAQHREDEVRSPRRQSPGAGPRQRARVHHQPEPRLRGR